MKNLSIDIETYSSEDLAKAGVYRYAEAPDFRILLFGCSVNGGPVEVYDLASGGELPDEILSALTDDRALKWAFNASFERVCLSRFLRDKGKLPEGEFLSPASWRCTMVRCAYAALPLSLAGAGVALGLDRQKMTEGRELIRFFCTPGRATKKNPAGGRNLPEADPERWKKFIDYNRRDVEVEMNIQRRLETYPVYENLWQEYAQDQEINDRGIRADTELVASAMRMDGKARRELTEALAEKTQLANPNSVMQVRGWLRGHGMEAESLGKKQVNEMIGKANPEIREVLLLRKQLAKNSVRKYEAIAKSVCRDGRVRGMFQFYGAPRSGRWAGRNVQLQNLPQNHLPDLEAARNLVKAGEYEAIRLLFGSVPDVLSELIRTAFVPAEGMKFIVCDFSAVEARVLAWLAGEKWRTEVFASGGDIYCASASQMFHVPVEKHGVNGHLRQKGKIAELALGYGGGAGALRSMGATEMGVPEEELQPLVSAWRQANPRIVELWKEVDDAVKRAVRDKTTVRMGALTFSRHSGGLFIRLPSGRMLAYPYPQIGESVYGSPCIEYMGLNTARKWDRIQSYGPKFTENIVQGISRDLLCNAMRNLKDCRIAAHVHDELIIEADPGVSAEEIAERMSVCPKWAEGLLLRADGYECAFYRKD
ncbi:MAG: hypothetical protein IJQ71_07315 [Clostridia bacterium]|nr:hypothetical protein [Clostridia bacterium]